MFVIPFHHTLSPLGTYIHMPSATDNDLLREIVSSLLRLQILTTGTLSRA